MRRDYDEVFHSVNTAMNSDNHIQWKNMASILNMLLIEVKKKISNNIQINPRQPERHEEIKKQPVPMKPGFRQQ